MSIGSYDVPREAAVAIELGEAETCWCQHQAAEDTTRKRLGLFAERIAGGVLILTTKSTNLYFNRLVAPGMRRAMSEAQIVRVEERARDLGASGLAVMVSPVTRPAGVRKLLEKRGFERGEPTAKMWRDARPLQPAPQSELSIRKVDDGQSDVWIDVVAQVWRTFGSRRDWYRSRVATSGWTHYLARSAGKPVGAAALFVSQVRLPGGEQVRVGHLVDGVTLRAARRRGVQTALIRRRVRDAIARGCEFLTSETAPPLPRRPLVSHRNLRRQGFEIACLRESWSLRWK